MAIYQPESFYTTTLASSITATQNTISVTSAPNITSGYLVIEANTSNREIIKYTGVTGTTLTGVVRGLATYGSDDSAGTGSSHAAGVDISNKDVHYYYAQYYDFLTGVSATGSNKMMIGDGAAISSVSTGRFWYACTSSVSAFWGLSANGQLVISEDGTTSWTISAGGSGVTAGDGINITAGVVDIDNLSSGGLRISADKLAVNYDGSTLKSTSAGELYYDPTVALTYSGNNTYSGTNTFSAENIGLDVELFDADEVIAVSVNPKPVKLTSAGRVYMCSSSSANYLHPFVGFAITASSAAGTQVRVKTKGLVDGFTGLTPGSIYYSVSAAGQFGTSEGTAELKLGIAGSATQILIDKNPKWEYISTVNGSRLDGTKYYWNIVVPSGAKRAIVDCYTTDNTYQFNRTHVYLDKYFKSTAYNIGWEGSYTRSAYLSWGTSSISVLSTGSGTNVSAVGIATFYT